MKVIGVICIYVGFRAKGGVQEWMGEILCYWGLQNAVMPRVWGVMRCNTVSRCFRRLFETSGSRLAARAADLSLEP